MVHKHAWDGQPREPEFEDAEQRSLRRKEEERRAYVNAQSDVANFPFEVGDTVWVVKPEYRAPLGEFKINRACPNDTFELLKVADGSIHTELVEGKYLTRDPFRAA
ncbi:MAG: hypothetical protein M1821_007047 [Bathelium mastoideum]|nr:MAG: hypothetical protein M1821_007047 [Bathelium mastoideum]